jgi:hypothetical protein
MIRLFPVLIALVSVLAVAPYTAEGQKPTAKKGTVPKSSQVYVKIILPIDPANRDKDQPIVESWIVEQLKKRGQSKFSAATGWVPLTEKGKFTDVWDGDGASGICPVEGTISERADSRVKVVLAGNIGWKRITDSLIDEPGSREIAVADYVDPETEQRIPYGYVAVLIGPPPEKTTAPIDPKK